ncbi:MAG: branched-chain amino acid ABC transporter substrate-binding protein [Candidatus Edwardsbacteria bacterium]|nr:branched-chain amino acid ABC transporter substrate-binding protein [Candidatus Edwardsbacteria bacterium]MBU1575778.1 branched-chain amino acid ABC transporter substrate-binding protein [Candidatus Edwardsbacteria bacterium]MBU2464005.1 branched-chain amino acid ABC transporter substrate-binding protein [Candidatus Edwardsbacteria bacterium]MBU2593239.1 branched-chain amino acid ABC transporter substrate-binding protein [Candidatus Edwardsbacteria bacterium]
MKKALVTVTILLAATTLLVLSGCEGGGEQIRIGVAAPLTGEQAKAGQDVLHGVQLAVSEWNAKGGVLGKRIVIIAGDDRADEKEAYIVAEKLANQRVCGIVGHYNSHCSIAGSRIYNQRMLPQISPSSTNPKFTEQGFINVFRTCGRDDQQGRVAADFAINNLKVKKVALFNDGTTYGRGLTEEFKKLIIASIQLPAGSRGKNAIPAVEIVAEAELQPVNEGQAPGYDAVLDPLISIQPDLVYFGGSYPEGAVLVRKIKERKLKSVFMAGDAIANSVYLKAGGIATEGTYFTFGPAVEDMPEAGRFYGSFKARYGEIGPYSVYSYDAAMVLLQAIEKAGITAGDSLVSVLHSQKFSGALGEIDFNAKGDITAAPYVIWRVKGGEFIPVKEGAENTDK